jgi:hypothetical protein
MNHALVLKLLGYAKQKLNHLKIKNNILKTIHLSQKRQMPTKISHESFVIFILLRNHLKGFYIQINFKILYVFLKMSILSQVC